MVVVSTSPVDPYYGASWEVAFAKPRRSFFFVEIVKEEFALVFSVA